MPGVFVISISRSLPVLCQVLAEDTRVATEELGLVASHRAVLHAALHNLRAAIVAGDQAHIV